MDEVAYGDDVGGMRISEIDQFAIDSPVLEMLPRPDGKPDVSVVLYTLPPTEPLLSTDGKDPGSLVALLNCATGRRLGLKPPLPTPFIYAPGSLACDVKEGVVGESPPSSPDCLLGRV